MRIISFRRNLDLAGGRTITCYFHHLHRVLADFQSEIIRLDGKPIAGVGNARLNRWFLRVKRRPISSDANRTEDPNVKHPFDVQTQS